MPFQIAVVTYKNRLPPRFEIQISFWNGYIFVVIKFLIKFAGFYFFFIIFSFE